MTPWMIELGGERFDLHELLRLNSSPGLSFTEEDGRFYLRADEFDSCADAGEVLNRGREILRVINGVAKIEIQNWENVQAVGVACNEANGTRTQFLFPQPIRGRSRVTATVMVIRADGTVENPTQKSTFESFLEVARKDAAAEKALRIYGSREHSWSNLYIIYEVIEADVGGKNIIVANGWVSGVKIEKFKRTANSVTATRDDARHGKEPHVPSPSPMLLSEAKAMIEEMLRRWMFTK